MNVRVLVVDDEPMGRRGITSRLARIDGVAVVGECANGTDAVEAIRRERPDVVFLDVQMPGMGGFDVIEALGADQLPRVIFVTAFDQHALRAFEVHAADYLLKPIDDRRFHEAVARAVEAVRSERESAVGRSVARLISAPVALASRAAPKRLAVRQRGRVVLVPYAQIGWVEAEGDYVRVHAGAKSWLMRQTLSALATDLDPQRFVRVHRSFVVNVEHVQEIAFDDEGDAELVLRDGTRVRTGRAFRTTVDQLSI